MFSSAYSRALARGRRIVLEEKISPRGLAPSPHMVSLWTDNKKPSLHAIPTVRYGESHDQDMENIIDTPLFKDTIADPQLEQIEALFKGDGRIDPRAYIPQGVKKNNGEHNTSQYLHPYQSTQQISTSSSLENIQLSHQEQIQRVKAAQSNPSYSPSAKPGFFQSLRFW